LQILANSQDIQKFQPHLKKCFDNIYALDFGTEQKSIDIFAMESQEGLWWKSPQGQRKCRRVAGECAECNGRDFDENDGFGQRRPGKHRKERLGA
jgi:hypothetical protein